MEYDYSLIDAQQKSQALVNGVNTASIIISIIVAAVILVSMWFIFKKAGKKGWIALIPLYNTYTLFEISWGNGWYFLLIFLGVIPVVGTLAMLVVVILTMIKLGKAFGKSTGFIVGLILLTIVFYPILAFDSSQYLGVSKKSANPM